jgi:hypothetical protein
MNYGHYLHLSIWTSQGLKTTNRPVRGLRYFRDAANSFFDLQHSSIDGDIGVSCCHTWLFKQQDNCSGLQLISSISCILIPCSITQWSFLHQKSVLSQSDSVKLNVLWFMNSYKPHHSPTTPKHIKNKHVFHSNIQIRLYISVKCTPPYSLSWTAPYVKEN